MRGNLWRGFLIGLVVVLLVGAGLAADTARSLKLRSIYGYSTWLDFFLFLLPFRLLVGTVIGSMGGIVIMAVR